jgi:hypothetical protein
MSKKIIRNTFYICSAVILALLFGGGIIESFAAFIPASEVSFAAKRGIGGTYLYRRTPDYRILQCNTLEDPDLSCDCDLETRTNIYYSLNPSQSGCSTSNVYTPKINIKYGHPIRIYRYSSTYDGCYYGDNVYPVGKGYLALFDTMDCKLANYFQYTPVHDLPGILMVSEEITMQARGI